MAHVPTLRTLGNMRVRDMPGYVRTNGTLDTAAKFMAEVKDWYYERYIAAGKINPLFHFMVFSSSLQYMAVLPYHRVLHDQHH